MMSKLMRTSRRSEAPESASALARPQTRDPRPASRSLLPAALTLIVGLTAGIAAGVHWHQDIVHWAGWHKDQGDAGASSAAAPKQLWTCGMHPQVIQDHPGNCPICGMALEPVKAAAPGAAAHESGSAITIDPVVVQNMGVRVAEAGTGDLERTIRAVGVLAAAQPGVVDVNLRVSGWIEKLFADTEGMHVSQGDPLFELYSPQLQVAIEELHVARRAVAQAAGEQASTVGRQTAATLEEAARRKLELWGLTAQQIDALAQAEKAPRTVTILSPASGDVMEKMVVQGAAVEAGQRAMRLVDRRTLWLDAQVYAQDLPYVKTGRKITATIESMPGREFEGTVVFIHPVIDPLARTALVRMTVDNPDLALRPGMYATVQMAAVVASDAVLVPREAVIDTGVRQVAFVSLGQGRFEPRELKVGPTGGRGQVQVVSGIQAGEQVVTSGQFLMDAESRMKEAIQKHLQHGLLQPAAATAPATAPAAKPAKAEAATQPAINVDEAVQEYLKIAKVLGQVQKNDTPVDPAALVKAAEGLALKAKGSPAEETVKKLHDAAKAMAGQTLDQQRESFKAVSQAAILLVEQATPSKAVGPKLYVMHCPMAPGSWLQNQPETANPYYATSMKQCATLEKTVETRP